MRSLFFEDWDASYGSPYLISHDQPDGTAVLKEDADGMRIAPTPAVPRRTAFVDGVRRGEGLLYRLDADGELVRGTVGAFACGAVLCVAGQRPVYGPIQTERLVIFGAGVSLSLPPADGYDWRAASIDSVEPDAPLAELQELMRAAEGQLAVRLARDGWLTVVDGTLRFVGSGDLPVVGLVKTHHQRLLPPDEHAQVAGLLCGERTPLFVHDKWYSCYVRIAVPGTRSSPWYGIVRLELPQSAGLEVARATVDEVACVLPGYAGIAHRDPRAPQNLQPVGALEKQLRRRLGPVRLASRAARIAVDLYDLRASA